MSKDDGKGATKKLNVKVTMVAGEFLQLLMTKGIEKENLNAAKHMRFYSAKIQSGVLNNSSLTIKTEQNNELDILFLKLLEKHPEYEKIRKTETEWMDILKGIQK